MFCPRCSIENGSEESYCRQCGQALTDVRLALQGAPTESLTKLRSGSHLLNGGIATVTIFMIIAVLITLLGVTQGHPVLITIGMLNALLGAVVGLPLILLGKLSVRQALRLLSGEVSARAFDSQRQIKSSNAGPDSTTNRLSPPGSVTDRTTLDLRRHREF